MKKTLNTLMSLVIATSVSFAGLFEKSPEDLKIKGLYIGMPMEDALVSCKKAVEGTKVSHWADEMKLENYSDGSSNIVIRNGFGMPLMIVVSDLNGNVNAFGFEWPAVEAIFNAKDMSLKEFAQLFIDSYNIPKLEPDEEGKNLVHTMESGVKITITSDKGFAVSRTQTQSQRKAAFN